MMAAGTFVSPARIVREGVLVAFDGESMTLEEAYARGLDDLIDEDTVIEEVDGEEKPAEPEEDPSDDGEEKPAEPEEEAAEVDAEKQPAGETGAKKAPPSKKVTKRTGK